MSKFRIKLKLQGLELDVEGSREDAPLMAQRLSQQFVGLIQPAAQLVTGDEGSEGAMPPAGRIAEVADPMSTRAPQRRGRRKRATTGATQVGTNGSSPIGEEPLLWRHDTEAWGAPQQSWTTAQKAIWLIFVAGQNTETKDLSSAQITNTFNRHFKSAGQVLKHNVTRDLSKLKGRRGSVISEDTTGETPVWFLTNTGGEYAKRLVVEAKGGPAAGSPGGEGAAEAQPVSES